MSVDQFLQLHDFDFPRFKHAAAYSCEEFNAIVPELGGAKNKNLFLQDKKGRRHLLVVTSPEHQVDLVSLAQQLGIKKLGFASEKRLHKILGVESGSVSILALVNDTDLQVELVVDQSIWQADCLQAHPLINTETVIIEKKSLERFLTITGHKPIIVKIPLIHASS